MSEHANRIARAMARFDAIHAADSKCIKGTDMPESLFYADRLTYWIHRLEPDPGDALLLAARCQHLKRYEHPRNTYPPGREGYLRWRKEMSRLHAQLSSEILGELGFDADTIAQVRRINLKSEMKLHADVQTMEDALCLLTLENQMDSLIASSDEEQLSSIIEKVWRKMSERAKVLAITIQHRPEVLSAMKQIKM